MSTDLPLKEPLYGQYYEWAEKISDKYTVIHHLIYIGDNEWREYDTRLFPVGLAVPDEFPRVSPPEQYLQKVQATPSLLT